MDIPDTKLIENSVDSSDRLSFTLFVALAVHGLLILGITFSIKTQPSVPPTFEVTLATHKSEKAPDKADYQAQFNQEASGTEDQAKELTTEKFAPFADTKIRNVNPPPESVASKVSEAQELQQIKTTANSNLVIAKVTEPDETEKKLEQEGKDIQVPLLSAEIASLKAKLDRQKQAYAKKPRIRRLTSVATTASSDAEYLNSWRQTVELVGNQNFPKQALTQRIFGQLRLAAIIKANGTIERVELLQSSGHSILDDAALQIVHMAAPFPPFPPEIAKDVDQLEIIRTWRFEITGLTTN
ncbi:MAG: energy transducer TonB [Cellvibrionaceae bacterium]